jgi:hypothetical protein
MRCGMSVFSVNGTPGKNQLNFCAIIIYLKTKCFILFLLFSCKKSKKMFKSCL